MNGLLNLVFLCIYIYIYMCMCTNEYICIYIYTYTNICIYIERERETDRQAGRQTFTHVYMGSILLGSYQSCVGILGLARSASLAVLFFLAPLLVCSLIFSCCASIAVLCFACCDCLACFAFCGCLLRVDGCAWLYFACCVDGCAWLYFA